MLNPSPGPLLIDSLDKPNATTPREDAPYAAPRRAGLSWRAIVPLTICALVALLLVFVALKAFLEDLYAFNDLFRMTVDAALITCVLAVGVIVIACALKLLIWATTLEQPGGLKVNILQQFSIDMAAAVLGVVRAQQLHAARQFPVASTVTLSNPVVAPHDIPRDVIEAEATVVDRQPPTLEGALARLPPLVRYAEIAGAQPSRLSVPLGIDHSGVLRWADMQRDMLHVGIFGGTGAGKDNLIENWFLRLVTANTPEQVQVQVLDGKGHWMQPKLANLAHMWSPPAGGIGGQGETAMRDALLRIQEEAQRRGKLIFGANCENAEVYMRRTGDTMPYLFVVISDVMGSIAGDVDKLLVDLVSKARALGIRVVVSLQTPTKQNTQWRSNLSTVFVGQMQGRSNDEPALGIAERDILFAPSKLPTPKQRPGVFSVRFGTEQVLLQAPLMDKHLFDSQLTTLGVRAGMAAPSSAKDLRLARLEQARQRSDAMSADERRALAAALAREGYGTRAIQYAARLRNEVVCTIWSENQPVTA